MDPSIQSRILAYYLNIYNLQTHLCIWMVIWVVGWIDGWSYVKLLNIK